MSDTVPVFDGHNDTLLRLWKGGVETAVESFMQGGKGGHIDLPRARAGSLAGGFFAMFPPPLRQSRADMSRPGTGEGLPPQLSQTAAAQATVAMAAVLFRLERAGALAVCRSAADIRAAMESGTIAAIFHIEGAEAIDPELLALDILHAAGLRSLGIVWSRSNAFGHGVPFRFPASPDIGPGLTDAGKALVRACNRMRILVDLSHLNEQGFRDVMAVSDAPLVATHSNVHALCESARNLTGWQLGAIRESRGMVGLNFATGFLRADGRMVAQADPEIMIRHLDALLEALGEDGVGLGSDFDGAVVPPAIGDVAGLPVLIDLMLKHGYGRDLVEKIAWRNWVAMIGRVIG